jgi:hypothetical protein
VRILFYLWHPWSYLSLGVSSPFVATEIEGTFRVNGSNKRMRDLQAVFETPPRVRVPVPQFPAVPTAHCTSSSPQPPRSSTMTT